MRNVLGTALLGAALMLSAAAAPAAEKKPAQQPSDLPIVGTVTDVREHPLPRRLFLNPDRPMTPGTKALTMSFVVTDRTKYEGRAKRLADVKTGDRVTVYWAREQNGIAVKAVRVD